ncbi:MAG: peptide-methionine (S)-S-oxide reductase MsrA [Phycisphaerales bacterium]|nr:peptide-methionine (S)-S-oxide reductase MsrA [Phycisphaerales bacterium]
MVAVLVLVGCERAGASPPSPAQPSASVPAAPSAPAPAAPADTKAKEPSAVNPTTPKRDWSEIVKTPGAEVATLALGCFWSPEEEFRKVKGVIDTEVGYTGGNTKNPTYKDVCTDTTGHAEALQIVFDPKVITYDEILDLFWQMHDPTQIDRQGPDVGTQYRTAIFTTNDAQQKSAKASKERWQKQFKKPIATEIVKLEVFYPAEEYHQRYWEKRGGGSCKVGH